MKRKIVNPNPQEKKMHQIEERLYEHEVKESLIKVEEEQELKKTKDNQKKVR